MRAENVMCVKNAKHFFRPHVTFEPGDALNNKRILFAMTISRFLGPATICFAILSHSAYGAPSGSTNPISAEPVDSVAYSPADSVADNVMELQDVVVTARKPLIQTEADRLIYNMDEDPAATTNNVLEMMRKVPMLTVDGEDNIKLKGGENYKIYLNGKPDPTLSSNYKEVLRSMPASMVRRIEVITEPGAKYDAEGLGGIINIITVQSTRLEGYLVNLGLYGGNNSVSESLYGTMKINRVTLSLNYSHYNGFGASSRSRQQVDYTDPQAPFSRYLKSAKSKSHNSNDWGSLQMSWEPDTLNLYTVSASLYGYRGHERGYSNTEFIPRQDGAPSRYTMNQHSYYDYLGSTAEANWQHNFSSQEHNIVLSYKYSYGHQGADLQTFYSDIELYPLSELTDRQRHTSYPTHEHTIQADYTHPFGKRHTLEVGGKFILRNNFGRVSEYFSDGELWIPQPDKASDMKQFQDVGSLYASYIGKFGPFMTKAGIRYEYTHMGTRFHTPGHTDFTSDFSDPVPSLLLSYKLTDASQLRVAYRMQISRPAVSQLDPSENRSNPMSISYGNPSLSSSRTNSISMTYSNYAGMFGGEGSVGYNRMSDLIAAYSFVDDSGVINTTYGNIGSCDALYLYLYLNARPLSGLTINASGSAQYRAFKAPFIDLNTRGWGGYFSLSADYDLPHDWSVGAYGGMSYSGVYMQSRGGHSGWYGVSIDKKLLGDRLTLSLSANDFLKSHYTYRRTSEAPGYTLTSEGRYPQWNIRFGIRYRLGSLSTSVRHTAKSVSNDDLSSGSSSGGSGGGK